MQSKDFKMSGSCLLQVKLGLFNSDEVVITECECNAKYLYEWQEDGGFWHEVGYYDYDFDSIKPISTNSFYLVKPNGQVLKNTNPKINILKVLQVLKTDFKNGTEINK